MKVAYDHQIFSMQRHGGISRYFAELIANLSKKSNMQLTVVAPVHINEYLRRKTIAGSVRGRYLPCEFRGKARASRLLNDALLPMAWRSQCFDIVHETYYSSTVRGRSRVRLVTIYDMIHELYPEDFADAVEVSRAKCDAVRRADHVICISETTRRDAEKILGLRPEESSVIYLGCSLDNDNHDQLPNSAISRCVLYVGQRSGYKNFEVVLKAFAASKLPGSGVDLVAFGGLRFTAEEQSAIRRLRLEERVRRITGNDALLRAYYKGALALVYPSRYEGFGIPPLEAMIAGCPVICSTAPSIREIVGDAAAYFPPEDESQLCSLLERILEDADFRDQLRALGMNRVGQFSWTKCAAETSVLYERLLNCK